MTSAVRDAVDSVLIPALRELRVDIQATNNSVKELREELEALATAAKQTRDRVDSVQAAAREDRSTVTDSRNQLERLTEKMTDIEDRSRRNNVRLVGLPEGAEGSNAAGFLRVNLSKWIPSLRDRDIEIDWAHRAYDGRKNSDRPRTLIFRVLRWHDRSEILKGARQAYPVKCTQDNVTLLFFQPSVEPSGERPLIRFWRRWQRLVSSPSSPIRRQLNYGTRVSRKVSTLLRKRRILSAPCRRGSHMLRLYKATGKRRPSSLRPGRRGLKAGMEAIPTAREKMVAGGDGYLLNLYLFFLFFSFLSPPGILFLFIRHNCLFAGKTNTLFSFLEGTNGE